MLALTATATQRVQRDVVLQLAMAHAVCFRSSFNRANLRLFPRSHAALHLSKWGPATLKMVPAAALW